MANDEEASYSPFRQYVGLVLCLVCVAATVCAPLAEQIHPMLDATYILIVILIVALFALYLHETRPARRMNYGEYEDMVTEEAKQEIEEEKKQDRAAGKGGKKETKKGK